jgi:hypothetical protein
MTRAKSSASQARRSSSTGTAGELHQQPTARPWLSAGGLGARHIL